MLLLTFVSNCALASWEEVSDTNDLVFYIDPATIQKTGNNVTSSVLFDFKKPNDAGSGKLMLSVDSQYEYDCAQVKARQLHMTAHSGNMGGGGVVLADSNIGKWEQMTPGSINSFLWMVACDIKVADGQVKVCASSLRAETASSGSLERLNAWKVSCPTGSEAEFSAKLEATRAFLLAKEGRIQTFNEADFAYQPNYLNGIAYRPLLRPDGKVYGKQDSSYVLLLDGEESDSILRAQLIQQYGQIEKKAYIFLRISNKTITRRFEQLGIGGEISVIGRYVENTKFQTVGGTEKIAPMLDVLFIEAH